MLKKIGEILSNLHWIYLIALTIVLIVISVLLIKFIIWLLPFVSLIAILIFVYTDGEIITMVWDKFKLAKFGGIGANIATPFYNWLTEEGISNLPISTSKYWQGIEVGNDSTYFVHLKDKISEEILSTFEMNVRQQVQLLSNDFNDCIIVPVRRDPFLAIKVRIVPANDVRLQDTVLEEDF
ncbi:hypothetical protein JEQ21_06780 [Streptococcus sp. 121]|uniref:hypothetical protein n=1 Tax=Streptococcus sp. 121 TaxID=2797637 RepID=UPI0018F0C28F|nr:hypothetical protein [Streptococcus sp. 121]MBJ6746160.1 hypothetical protein [Streptococcus sp. 121]